MRLRNKSPDRFGSLLIMLPNLYKNDATSSSDQSGGQSGAAPSGQSLGRLVNELSVEFISILDLHELIEHVARRVGEVIDYKFFSLFLVDEARSGLVWKKAVGYSPEEVAAHEVIPYDRSVASAAWREGLTINVGDVSPFYREQHPGESDRRQQRPK